MRTLILTMMALLAGYFSVAYADEPTMTAPAAAVEEEKAFKPPAGYKTKVDGAAVYYCKKQTIVGSRFPKEICMTEGQLKRHLATLEKMKRNKDQVSSEQQ